jgi:hypothetical protein
MSSSKREFEDAGYVQGIPVMECTFELPMLSAKLHWRFG